MVVITITQAAFLTLDDCWGPNKKWTWDIRKKHGLDSLSFGICVWDSTKNNMPRDRPIPFHTGKSNQNHSCIFCLLSCWETATSERKRYRFHETNGSSACHRRWIPRVVAPLFRRTFACEALVLAGLKILKPDWKGVVTATLNPWPDRWTSAYRRMRCYLNYLGHTHKSPSSWESGVQHVFVTKMTKRWLCSTVREPKNHVPVLLLHL